MMDKRAPDPKLKLVHEVKITSILFEHMEYEDDELDNEPGDASDEQERNNGRGTRTAPEKTRGGWGDIRERSGPRVKERKERNRGHDGNEPEEEDNDHREHDKEEEESAENEVPVGEKA